MVFEFVEGFDECGVLLVERLVLNNAQADLLDRLVQPGHDVAFERRVQTDLESGAALNQSDLGHKIADTQNHLPTFLHLIEEQFQGLLSPCIHAMFVDHRDCIK